MKAKFNYKSKKNIIIIAIAAILLVAAIVGTVAFIKGNQDAAAAMTGDDGISTSADDNGGANENDAQNSGDEPNNLQEQIPTVGGENDTTATEGGNVDTSENGNNAGANNNTANNAGTTTGTNENTVPNQEYTQTTTQITEKPWETTVIGWSPITVSAKTLNVGINKAELQKVKLVYVGNGSLDEEPVRTVAQKGEELTYVIKVTNSSNIDANNIKIYDSIPEGTQYVEGSISDNGTIENNNLSWKVNIAKGETKTVSFKVMVITDEFSTINNTAKVDGENTNEVHTPIITTQKTSELIIKDENGIERVEERNAKVGETIRYKINIVNTSEYEGKISIYDIVPEGTTLVEGSISNEGLVESTTNEKGIETKKIVWDNVQISANGTTTVSFDVTINEKKINPETLLEENVTFIKNQAVVGNYETNEVEDKVVNIKTVKTSVGTHKDGTLATEKNPLHELDKITYTLTSTNYGEGTGSVVITDELPDGTRLLNDDTTVESKIVDSDGNEYTEQELKEGIILTLKPEENKSITFTVTINPFIAMDETQIVDGIATKHITNMVAKQDGELIPGTDNLVEKEYKKVSVTKLFEDKENVDGHRPETVLVGLFTNKDTDFTEENALATTTLTDKETYVFEKLDKYDLETSEEIIYTVREINVDEYYSVSYVEKIDENNKENTITEITNTLIYENVKTTKTATKVWLDNNNQNRPEQVTLAIYDEVRNYTQTQNATNENVDENGNWQVTFTDLQKYREDGTEIEYTFDEPTVPIGYVKEVNGNTITNKLPEIEVIKTIISVNDAPVDQDEECQKNVIVKSGDIVEYQIIVTNTGNVTLNHVTLEDVLENNGKVYFDKELTQEANTIIDYDNDLTLEPEQNSTYTVYYQLTQEDTANVEKNPDLQNKVTAKGYYDITDENGEVIQNPDPVTDEDTAEVNFKRNPSLSIVKEQYIGVKKLDANETTTKLQPGQVIDYTITIKNTGNTNLTEVEFTDVMDVAGSARKVDEIRSVKVNKANRTYSVVNDTTIRLNGVLAVGDELVITAKYTVQESDMSADKENTIKNTATVDTKETEPDSDKVNIQTVEWDTILEINKIGYLQDKNGNYTINADPVEAEGETEKIKTVKYGDTIKYVLTVTNSGKKPGTYKVQDKDLETLANNAYISEPTSVKVYKNTTTNEVETTHTVNELYTGFDVYVPGESSKRVEFIVTVTAPAGTTFKNTVVGNTTDKVENTVVSEATISSTKYNGKNIVVVLDLSSSMLKEASGGTDSYPSDGYDKGVLSVEKLNSSKNTKLYKAKQALTKFVENVLTENPNNTITLVSFNFDTMNHAQQGLSYKNGTKDYSYYWDRVKDEGIADDYIGTKTLLYKESNKTTINEQINSIKLTYPLLTNVVAALEETETQVNKLKAEDPNKDVEVVFIGDGKPSYNTEPCGLGTTYKRDGTINKTDLDIGFYLKEETFNKIEEVSNCIKYNDPETKKSVKSHIYTVEYAVPSGEKDAAQRTFEIMASGENYRKEATMEGLVDELTNISEQLSTPLERTETTNASGDVIFNIESNSKLCIGSKTPVELLVKDKNGNTETKKTFTSLDENGKLKDTTGIVEYKNGVFTIHVGKCSAGSSVSLSYYYNKQTSN